LRGREGAPISIPFPEFIFKAGMALTIPEISFIKKK
jgi:hypothetical protein